jgi:type 1 glutamine amidotransferase
MCGADSITIIFLPQSMKNRFLASIFILALAMFTLSCQTKSREEKPPHIVFLISEDPLNYKATTTIPPFARQLSESGLYKTTVLQGEGEKLEAHHFPGLEALDEADLLVVFCRRLALPPEQMQKIKGYLAAGKPLIGLRTANHGFSVRDTVADGYEDWWGFVPEILGCENRGYEPEELGTDVKLVDAQVTHPILKGIDPTLPWRSNGQVYKVAPLIDTTATVLLTGSTGNVTEPFAWTRKTADGSPVFYTALGYPDDFQNAQFIQLLHNAISWTLGQ